MVRGRGGGYGRGRGGRSSNTPARPPLTHFLCFPLVSESSRPELQEAFKTFGELPDHGLFHKDAVRPVGTLHLTLGVMSLTNPESRLQGAIDFLNALDIKELLTEISESASKESSEVSEVTAPLHISLTALQPMQQPATSVLYAVPTDPTNRLQGLAEKLNGLFVDAGFVNKEDRALKLHATVINTTYSKSSSFPRRFEAAPIVEQSKDLVWLKDLHLDRLAICKMGATKVTDSSGAVVDSVYEEVASIPLPG